MLSILLIFPGLLLFALVKFWSLGRRRKDSPPGPRTYPILGNFFDLCDPQTPLFLKYYEFGKKYGSYMSFVIGEQTTLVLQDDGTAVKELLDKRGAKYSHRPKSHLLDRLHWGHHLVGQRNYETWRTSRKLMVQHFSMAICEREYAEIQDAESIQMLYDFLHKPHELMEHPMRYAASSLTSITYGMRSAEYNDVMRIVDEFMTTGSAMKNPNFMPPIDPFPILLYLPDFIWPWKGTADKIGNKVRELYAKLAEQARARALEGRNTQCFASRLYSTRESHKLTDLEIHYLCGLAIEGGADVVANSILACCMALINNPDVQRKAHAELDRHCGEDHIPKWSDQMDLPYIRMIVKETLRWRPPFPMGVPHALEEDDIWQGYFMPKGSTVVANVWAIHMNPDRYPNPQEFNPERYSEHKLSMAAYLRHPDPLERDHFAFGAGRRSCPGVQLAEQGLFIGIATLLWAFELSSVDGQKIDDHQETAFSGGSSRRPNPFPMVARPRSQRRLETIDRGMITARESVFSRFE